MFSKTQGNTLLNSTTATANTTANTTVTADKTARFSPVNLERTHAARTKFHQKDRFGKGSNKSNSSEKSSTNPNANSRSGSSSNSNSNKQTKTTPEIQQAKKLEKLSKLVFIGTFITIASVAFALISIVSSQAAVNEATGNTKQVLIATQEIPAGTAISGSMVSTKEVPSAYVSSNAYSDVNEIIGKTTATAIGANSQISEFMVSTSANTSSLAAKIPKGSKAVSVNVSSNNGVSNLLRCGDKVNVYSANSSTSSMRKIAGDVLVLALDSSLAGPEANTTYSTVTLQVTEAQSEEIIDAQTSDTIFLTLNSQADSSTTNSNSNTSNTIANNNTNSANANNSINTLSSNSSVNNITNDNF